MTGKVVLSILRFLQIFLIIVIATDLVQLSKTHLLFVEEKFLTEIFVESFVLSLFCAFEKYINETEKEEHEKMEEVKL